MIRFRYLLAENTFSIIVIFEQRNSVGGIGYYTPLPLRTQRPVNGSLSSSSAPKAMGVVTASLPELNTSMYEGLESNLPHMLTQFSDTPFPKGTQLFPRRETVLQYLRDYASEITDMIRFDHEVIEVKMMNGGECHEWEVMTRAGGDKDNIIKRFDALVAANGHCDWPLLPSIEGLDAWSEELSNSLYHSVSYKNPKPFEKRVSKHFICLPVRS